VRFGKNPVPRRPTPRPGTNVKSRPSTRSPCGLTWRPSPRASAAGTSPPPSGAPSSSATKGVALTQTPWNGGAPKLTGSSSITKEPSRGAASTRWKISRCAATPPPGDRQAATPPSASRRPSRTSSPNHFSSPSLLPSPSISTPTPLSSPAAYLSSLLQPARSTRNRVVFLLEVPKDRARVDAEIARRLGAVAVVPLEHFEHVAALEVFFRLFERDDG
jgi:hypothetical protein